MDARPPNGIASTPAAPHISSAEVLGQLVGQFVHDLNNLLATALIGVELAAQLNEDQRVRTLLAGAADAIHRQRSLAADMARAALACGRAEPLDMHVLLEACGDDLRTALGGAELELQLGAEHARVCCDRGFLRTALLHLAANAGASMPHGGYLRLSTCNRTVSIGGQGRDCLLLTVVDSGLGMTDEIRRQAFDLFFSTREHACGLGLAQVRDTLRRAGGSVALESDPEQGTAVQLTFPLVD